MKLLLIEDDEYFASAFIAALPHSIETTLAKSRDSAMEHLATVAFDVIICDLRIPSSDNSLDDAVNHGRLVLREIMENHTGTPTIVFSAYGDMDLMDEVVEARQEDAFGTGETEPMIRHIPKTEVSKCIGRVNEYASRVQQLESIEIATGLGVIQLSENQRKALRIYCRRKGGVVARVRELTGGLTESKTLHVVIDNADGAIVSTVVAKLAPLSAVADEKRRYDQFIPGTLTVVGSFTALADEVRAGAGDIGGLFYQLAGGFSESLFDLVRNDENRAAAVVNRLRGFEEPWQSGASRRMQPIRSIRESIAPDWDTQEISRALGLDVEPVERREIYVSQCTQHCDLHGLNVLIRAPDQPVLLDFGSVANANAALDPVTLELSPIFHPDIAGQLGDWPDQQTAEKWADLDAYLAGCPIPEFIRECRSWAHDVAAGDHEVHASGYACAVRQLRFENSDHGLAAALTRGALAPLL